MNNLESLVPPLELCKRIPAGKFEDSVFAYLLSGYSLNHRFGERVDIENEAKKYEAYAIVPAPTLAEILEALHVKFSGRCGHIHTTCVRDRLGWDVCVYYGCDGNGIGIDAFNPAAAALRLWLEVEGVKDE